MSNKYKNQTENIMPAKSLIIVFILFLFFSIVFIIFGNIHLFKIRNLDYNLKNMKVNNVKIDYPKFNIQITDKIIKNLLKKEFENISGNVTSYINIMDKRYICLFFEIDAKEGKKYKNYIIDAKKNEFVDIRFLVKKGKEKKLNDKIIEMLRLKYPEFIVNGILSTKGQRYYKVKNNEVIIYYKNFDINPKINEDIYINLNYNEIKDILNVDCKVDKNYQNENTYKIDSNKPIVLFTFDDGPSSVTTPQLLDILKKNKVHATFFELGSRMEANREITKRAIDEGNTVGSHSYYHLNLKKASPETISEDIMKTESLYQEITGNNYRFFRVPYGSYNQTVKDIVNHPIIEWNEDPRDWESRDTNQIVDMVLSHLHDGSMYVMHDIYQSTIDAMDILLPEIYSRGYQVLSLDEVESIYGVHLEDHVVYRDVK